MSRWTPVLLAAALALQPDVAAAQHLGIFTDPGATSSAAEVGAEPSIELHVVLIPGGEVMHPSGVQFQITGLPESWNAGNVLWNPQGGWISIGNPLFPADPHADTPGVNVAWGCRAEVSETLIPIGTIIVLGAPTPKDTRLRVEGFELVVIDPDCPFATLCDHPRYSKVCVEGGEVVLNGSGATSEPTAVEERPWAGIKSLYR